jgi:hypothetical protein
MVLLLFNLCLRLVVMSVTLALRLTWLISRWLTALVLRVIGRSER